MDVEVDNKWLSSEVGKNVAMVKLLKIVEAKEFRHEVKVDPFGLKLGFYFYKEDEPDINVTFTLPIRKVKEMNVFNWVYEQFKEYYDKYKEENK